MPEHKTIRDELERIRKVSDALCSGHAALRERFSRRALVLDLAILFLTTWLVAVAFVPRAVSAKLDPLNVDPQIWIGFLGVGTFLLYLLQLKTDLKTQADAHKRTVDLYAEVKREAGYVLASQELDESACRRVLSRYDMASAVGVAMPESEFLKQKRRHRIKVVLSEYLDSHPSASILLTRVRFWWRDNWGNGS